MVSARAALGCVALLGVLVPTSAGASVSDPPSNVALNPDFTTICATGTGVIDNTQTCIAATLRAIDNARSAEGVSAMVLPTHFASMSPEEQLLAVTDRERADRGLVPFAGAVAELTGPATAGADAATDPPVNRPSYAGSAWQGTSEYAGGLVNALGADYYWLYHDGWGGSPETTENKDCRGPSDPACWDHRHGILSSFSDLPNLSMGGALNASAANGQQSWTMLLMATQGVPPGYTSTWAAILADSPGGGGPCGSAAPPAGKVGRIAGDDRDRTAVLVSRQSYPDPGSARVVILASDADFPDALAGGPLAVTQAGPLLINPPNVLAGAVEAEIIRVLPDRGTVDILGGTLAISAAVELKLVADGFSVVRLSGSDRYATAVKIAEALGSPSTVIEATGHGFADALAAGPAASSAHAAILLTDGAQQAPATDAYLALHPGSHYAVGGPAAAADPAATPIVGGDRYATAVMVTKTFVASPSTLGFATGGSFPDALAAGPSLAKGPGGLLLVPKCPPIPSSVIGYVQSVSGSATNGTLFGGTFAVTDDTLTQIDLALSLGS
ncbi:MAG: cell wall-binding repeat-containing protein [Acidimicrobiales bacterium]